MASPRVAHAATTKTPRTVFIFKEFSSSRRNGRPSGRPRDGLKPVPYKKHRSLERHAGADAKRPRSPHLADESRWRSVLKCDGHVPRIEGVLHPRFAEQVLASHAAA